MLHDVISQAFGYYHFLNPNALLHSYFSNTNLCSVTVNRSNDR